MKKIRLTQAERDRIKLDFMKGLGDALKNSNSTESYNFRTNLNNYMEQHIAGEINKSGILKITLKDVQNLYAEINLLKERIKILEGKNEKNSTIKKYHSTNCEITEEKE